MINSRNIDELKPSVAAKCRAFIAACRSKGIEVLITSTYRDIESQNALYAQGRTTPGKIVTKAKGGDSAHNYRIAFDFVPLHAGEPVWNNSGEWALCGTLAMQCGLEWGGSWTGFVDKPHCQDLGGYTFAQYRTGVVA